jgi:ABC-type multidrug transport system ATPase subunit
MFEGDRSIIVREDGTEDETKIQRISAEMAISLNGLDSSNPKAVLDQIDKAAKEMAIQKSKMIMETIEEAVDRVGNVVDDKGQQFGPDHIFRMLEKIWIEFDADDKPILPTIVADKKGVDRIAEVFREMEKSPEMKTRFDELIETKRNEWRDREARRQLVG